MSRDHWTFRALQLFLAASVALGVAWGLGITNPFWAAMPVWVVSQSWRQDLVIRGVLRILGTMLGAGLGLVMLAHVHDPVALVALYILGVGAGTFAAFWIGTIYSYGALMAAITLGVVVLPGVATAGDPWDLALGRVWCTLIGVASVTLFTFPFTPRRDEAQRLRLDHGLGRGLRHGAVAGLIAGGGLVLLLLIGQFWIVAGALALTVFASIMGSMPDPRPLIRYLPPAAALGVVAAVAYRGLGHWLGLGDPGLYLLGVGFIGAGALLRAHPRLAPFGLDSNMCFLLTAEVGAIGHGLPQEAAGGLALVCGTLLVTAVHRRLLPAHLA